MGFRYRPRSPEGTGSLVCLGLGSGVHVIFLGPQVPKYVDVPSVSCGRRVSGRLVAIVVQRVTVCLFMCT